MMNSLRKQVLDRVIARFKGRPVDVPRNAAGRDLRQAMAVPSDRMLIVRSVDGGTVQRVPDDAMLEVDDGTSFEDVPVARWGEVR